MDLAEEKCEALLVLPRSSTCENEPDPSVKCAHLLQFVNYQLTLDGMRISLFAIPLQEHVNIAQARGLLMENDITRVRIHPRMRELGYSWAYVGLSGTRNEDAWELLDPEYRWCPEGGVIFARRRNRWRSGA